MPRPNSLFSRPCTISAPLTTLFTALTLALMFCVSPASAGGKDVCAIADFGAFFHEYLQLDAAEQAVCLRFPITAPDTGKTVKDIRQWQSTRRGKLKLIFDPSHFADLGGQGANPFFYPEDTHEGTQGPGVREYCYIIKGKTAGKRTALLTEGGTAPFESVVFEWDGSRWQVTAVRDETLPDGI